VCKVSGCLQSEWLCAKSVAVCKLPTTPADYPSATSTTSVQAPLLVSRRLLSRLLATSSAQACSKLVAATHIVRANALGTS
jgi:hypothetical protein